MVALDDGFADAKASQISLMNKFTVVYENSAIKNLPDFEISSPGIWNGFKNWISDGNIQGKGSIDDHLSRDEGFESKHIAYSKMNLNWVTRLAMKFYKTLLQKKAAKHLRKFEQNFAKYEELFEEWKENEDSRFNELEQYISDLGESLDTNQVNHLIKTSNTFKGLAEDLVPKFLEIVERLVELSQQFSEYEPDEPNRYECLAVEARRSFDGQIEDLLDFSDYYRGLACAYDPNNKVVKVFDDVDSLFKYIETV